MTETQKPDPSGFAIPQNWTFEDAGVAAGFDRHVREQLPWYDLATGALAHFARHYLPVKGLVYDLGASTGNVGRALAATLEAREARLIPVEPSAHMAELYSGPGRAELFGCPAEAMKFEPCDVVVMFLSLMFVPVRERSDLLRRAFSALRQGGALLVLDKVEPPPGYPGTILRRLAMAGKRASGVSAEDIVDKELSLSGVQRPLHPELVPSVFRGESVVEWFRFGEFRGWSVER